MAYAPNESRNFDLVQKRISDPQKWTWGKLGNHFDIHRSVAKQIFERDIEKYAKEDQIEEYQKSIKDPRIKKVE